MSVQVLELTQLFPCGTTTHGTAPFGGPLPRDGALDQEEFMFMSVAAIVQGGNSQLKEGAPMTRAR